jgi:hypothetical protein
MDICKLIYRYRVVAKPNAVFLEILFSFVLLNEKLIIPESLLARDFKESEDCCSRAASAG